MEKFISVEDARRHILFAIDRVGTERRFISEANGHHAAETMRAPEDSPPFDNSSRDGFAVRWSDISTGDATLDLVGESAAGAASDREVGPGEAMRISTGAKIPEGADTVVMQENCQRDGNRVKVVDPPEQGRGSWIRRAGSHLREGEPIVEPGDRIGPAEIGTLASFRDARIEVHRAPRVAIVSTGDELVDIDESPGEGEIVNSNVFLLESLLEDAGADPIVVPTVPDDYEETHRAFRKAIDSSDLVVSSGGVSVGTHDEVREVVDELTGGMNFWKIRMKPGKPLAFGTSEGRRNIPLIGLPGNPNSCFVCFHQFVEPALRVARGSSPGRLVERPRLRAVLEAPVDSTDRRRHYLAGRLHQSEDDSIRFCPAPRQSSGNVALFCGQTALGIVPEDVASLESGSPIEVELLDAGYFASPDSN